MKNAILYITTLALLFSCKENVFERIEPQINDEFAAPEGTTAPLPYPLDSSFTVNSIVSVETEKSRLDQKWNSSDFVPTGWYAEEGKTIIVNLKRVKGDYYPKLIIGTYNRYAGANNEVKEITLLPGNNTIQIERSGLIYIRYTGETNQNQAIVKFSKGVTPAPYFVAGKTTKEEWKGMLNTYINSPDAVLFGGKIIMVVNRRTALDNIHEDQNELLRTANQIWEWEEDIAGLDNSSPLHARNPHYHLMTETSDPDYYMAAFLYGTMYNGSTAVRVLVSPTELNSWGPWHELGHHHQQASYHWTGLSEVTVNIYSLYVQEMLGKTPELKSRGTWPAVASYLAQANASKNFDAIEDLFVKLAMFRQLQLAFGNQFIKDLHKYTRENKLSSSSTDAAKKDFLMIAASKISKKNLSLFFQKWGFSATEFASTYTKINALNYAVPANDITKLQDN